MVLPPPLPVVPFAQQDLRDLRHAKALLEHPSLAARLAHLVGSPIEKGFQLLPAGWSQVVQNTSRTALLKALDMAVASLGRRTRYRSSDRMHKLLAGASGAVGGTFGLAALPIELPVSTAIMLRSIAEIARSEGHDLGNLMTRLNCLEVFAMGGQSSGDDAAESGYWAVRTGLAKAVSDAALFLAQRGVVEKTAPAILRLIAAIGARFGVVVSEQLAAKAVPFLGAATGSLVNVMFIDHFQDMAHGHFIVRRLEAKYGVNRVRETYLASP